MCDYAPFRERAMTVLEPGKVWCDPCIAPIVKALNDAGLETVASCCGHGKRPGRISLANNTDLTIRPTVTFGQQDDGSYLGPATTDALAKAWDEGNATAHGYDISYHLDRDEWREIYTDTEPNPYRAALAHKAGEGK